MTYHARFTNGRYVADRHAYDLTITDVPSSVSMAACMLVINIVTPRMAAVQHSHTYGELLSLLDV